MVYHIKYAANVLFYSFCTTESNVSDDKLTWWCWDFCFWLSTLLMWFLMANLYCFVVLDATHASLAKLECTISYAQDVMTVKVRWAEQRWYFVIVIMNKIKLIRCNLDLKCNNYFSLDFRSHRYGVTCVGIPWEVCLNNFYSCQLLCITKMNKWVQSEQVSVFVHCNKWITIICTHFPW